MKEKTRRRKSLAHLGITTFKSRSSLIGKKAGGINLFLSTEVSEGSYDLSLHVSTVRLVLLNAQRIISSFLTLSNPSNVTNRQLARGSADDIEAVAFRLSEWKPTRRTGIFNACSSILKPPLICSYFGPMPALIKHNVRDRHYLATLPSSLEVHGIYSPRYRRAKEFGLKGGSKVTAIYVFLPGHICFMLDFHLIFGNRQVSVICIVYFRSLALSPNCCRDGFAQGAHGLAVCF
jgi:hypothetical protein